MMLDLESLLPIALRAVDTARDLILSRPPASVTEKSDRDLVSDVDLAIEQATRTYLHRETPDIGFLGEEEGGTTAPGTGWVWTLDPIDGTSNYAHRIPLCAVSLALLHDGRPVLGVIDAPFLGERFHAIEGHGAWSGTRRLAVSSTTRLRDAVVALGDYAVGTNASRKNEGRLAATVQLTSRVHRIRMLGTAALDLAWLADGRLDASITIDNTAWDFAAGVIIAREAGAVVVDTDGRPHNLSSDATIAAPESLIRKIIPIIQAADLPESGSRDTQIRQSSPYVALDLILSRARHLIFDFDGPVCNFPAATGEFGNPTAYIHETLAACRDSGRTATIISSRPEKSVKPWLVKFSLADQIENLITPTAYPPSHSPGFHEILREAVSQLQTTMSHCALITSSTTNMRVAQNAGLEAILYTSAPADAENNEHGAACVIRSLADLALRLRARLLPS